MSKRYAVYGGTFDPLHAGHMALAMSAFSECRLDRLIFMPDYISPFKQGCVTASGADRYNMIKAATEGMEGFEVSDYEIRRERPSYTIETLNYLSGVLEGDLCFVLGFDSAVQIDKWYKGSEILSAYPLITAVRSGTDTEKGLERIEHFKEDYGADITVLGMEPVDASSTEIRRRVKAGISISGLVPPAVEEYIRLHGLYL